MKDSALPAAEPQTQSRWTPDSPHRALRMALASASLLSLAAPLAAHAAAPVAAGGAAASATPASGVYVAILSPNPGTPLAGVKQVEIRAYYESAFGVAGLDLFIDGHKMATQQLAKPEERGEISFLVAASALRPGPHAIVVRATAADEEVSSARADMTLPPAAPDAPLAAESKLALESAPNLSAAAGIGPAVGIVSPGPSATVGGIVEIKVDASGKAPYVSLFVDHEFKTLRNYAPYVFDLDTNRLANGKHTVEVWGYNDAQQVTHARPIEIFVNNPGGHTFERHDLLDSSAAPSRTHVTRGGIVIASHPPVSAARPAALHVAPRHGSPSIAHTARKAMNSLIAKADHLASLGSIAAIDSAGRSAGASASAAMSAPAFAERGVSTDVFETRTFAAPTHPKAAQRTHAVVRKLTAGQVPALRAPIQSPLIASLNPHSAQTLAAIAPVAGLEPSTAASSLEDSAGNSVSLPLAQPNLKIQLHAAAVHPSKSVAHAAPGNLKIASSNLGESMAAATPAERAIAAATAKPVPAEAHHTALKSASAHAASLVERMENSRIVLADFRPHTVAALRGSDQVMVNQTAVGLTQPLQDRGAVLFAPMRDIIERQGGTLDWDASTRQVTAVTANRSVKITIGSRAALVNNQQVKLNSAPYLRNDRTMLPLDFFQKAMNANVSYDSATGHLIIQSK